MQKNSSDFKEFINNNYYIDKTLFIEELLTKGSQSIFFGRPRGFGKTLNLSMLKYYFDIRENSRDLFKGFKIEKSSLFEKHLNKYPTIYLTFKEIKSLSSWAKIGDLIKTIISNLYKEHDYLLESDKLDHYDKKEINEIINKEVDYIYYKFSLEKLTEYLYKHYDKEVLVLLDDHDIVSNPLYNKETYENVAHFLGTLMSSTFKGNKYLYIGVMTGIFKVPADSIFSGANNIDIVNILDNRFSDKFGFTESEVIDALKHFNVEVKIEEVRKWYGGYTFGNDLIYNPLSISNYIKKKELKNYWIDIDQDLIIKNLLNSDYIDREDLAKLITGDSMDRDIEENVIFRDPDKFAYIWSILVYSGYLKASRDNNSYYLYDHLISIPNQEIRNFYIEVLENEFNKKMPNGYKIMDLISKGDIEEFKKLFVKEIETKLESKSIGREFDFVYQLFLIGAIVSLKESYKVEINRNFEYGGYVIYLISNIKDKLGYMIMFKEVKDKSLEREAEDVLNQIKSKKYSLEIEGREINKIIALVIAIKKKKVFIKEKKIL